MSFKTIYNTIDSAHALISKKCVNNCLFCATADKRLNREFPSREKIIRFIENSHKAGISNMILSGLGEPTLDPCFEDYLKTAGELGFDTIRVFTNGYELTYEKAARWKSIGLTDVLLSIHGLENGHDENVQRSGAFKETVQALEIYSQLNSTVSVNSCLTRNNLNEIPGLIDFLSPHPIKIHTLAFPEWSGNALRFCENLADYEEIGSIADSLLLRDDTRTFFDNIPYCLVKSKTIEIRGMSAVSYLDGRGENEVRSTDRKLFHEFCYSGKCRYISRCSGFEKNYIKLRGWRGIPEKIKVFLNLGFVDSRTIKNREKEGLLPEPAGYREKIPENKSSFLHRNRITVILRPTDRCNVSCVYCSSYKTQTAAEMSPGFIEKLYDKLFSYAKSTGIRQICFLWHGGEPLMMSKKFYTQAWELFKKSDAVAVKHLIQTNLLNLDEEWIDLFRRFDVSLGTSADPIDDIRIFKDGRQQYHAWLDKLMLVCESGLSVGIVFTVTSKHLERSKEIYGFFKNIQSLSPSTVGVKINPVYSAGKAAIEGGRELAIGSGEYGIFLCKLWELWDRDGRIFPISPFKEWLNPKELSCEFAGHCHEKFLSIDGNGDVYNCARFADSGIKFGNILNNDFISIMNHPARLKLVERNEALRRGECGDCDLWEYCHGGCPYFAEIYTGDLSRCTAFCESYRIFFKRYPINGRRLAKAAY